MARRFGSRGVWAVLLSVAVAVLVGTALLIALRPDHGGPTAGPTTTAPTTTAPTTTAPTTTAPTITAPSTSAPSTPAPSTSGPPPVPPVPAGYAGKDLTVLPTSRHVVALTFDAGANSAGLQSILRTLADEHVHGTFFLTGQWAAANPSQVAAIRAAGHRIGNHSVSHPHFTALTDAQIRDQVLGAEQTIRAAGADPRPLFRFPFGDRTAHTIAVLNGLGYVPVRWTVDTLGWQGTSGGMTAAAVADRALGSLQPGEIVLMHVGSNPDDGTTLDADALPGVIDRMRSAGYDFATLDALLG